MDNDVDTSGEACERVAADLWLRGQTGYADARYAAALIRALCAERDELRLECLTSKAAAAGLDCGTRFVLESKLQAAESELSSLRAKLSSLVCGECPSDDNIKWKPNDLP